MLLTSPLPPLLIFMDKQTHIGHSKALQVVMLSLFRNNLLSDLNVFFIFTLSLVTK